MSRFCLLGRSSLYWSRVAEIILTMYHVFKWIRLFNHVMEYVNFKQKVSTILCQRIKALQEQNSICSSRLDYLYIKSNYYIMSMSIMRYAHAHHKFDKWNYCLWIWCWCNTTLVVCLLFTILKRLLHTHKSNYTHWCLTTEIRTALELLLSVVSTNSKSRTACDMSVKWD